MTSTDDSTQIQAVTTNGSSSDENNRSISDSSHTTTYEKLIQDSDIFYDKLRDFLGYTDKHLKDLLVGGNSLNLHQLFKEVTARGGIEKVIKERKCKAVIATFALETPITNASFVLKKYYVPMLLKLEHVFYSNEPLSSFSARGQNNTNHMGSKQLKGVLYRLKSRRRKKKSKSSDPNKPKFYRSGYSFFYMENRKRLKPHFPGQLINQEIPKMWHNLSPSDKVVYQEKSCKDKERYEKEILDSRATTDAAMNDAAAAAEAETAAVADAVMNDATDSDATESDAATDAAMNDPEETDAATEAEEAQ
ncbi:unnamed protein product [Arabis nemorensis]|uniref:HMG box domain-containing protein n=1 Tax=Arabis nemorensis TaxID=586526 RepID=A0A565BEX6_9BRAS|nr:unnamed protein product [Arabis nemorensis]